MITYLSQDKAAQFAHSAIHDFFDCYGLQDAIWHCETIISAAGDKQPWKKEAPYHLLLFIEKLHELCIAAIAISHQYTIEAAIAIVQGSNKQFSPDLSHQADFVNPLQHSNPWDCFPRNLTQKQYTDPYKAIKKFAAYMPETSCTKILKNIQEYALSKSTIDEAYTFGQLLKIRLRLLQLIEACHLIEVRTSTPKTQASAKQKKENPIR
jgi:hypothetical protein